MENWRRTRNYGKIYDENGQVVANIITAAGEKVPVSNDIFDMYAKMDRRERYVEEREAALNWRSLDQLAADKVPIGEIEGNTAASAEDEYLESEEERVQYRLSISLNEAVGELQEDERHLIQALFYENMSARKYADSLGVSLSTLQYRRNKVLKKLREKLSEKI